MRTAPRTSLAIGLTSRRIGLLALTFVLGTDVNGTRLTPYVR